jgi:hypothetical protein
MIPEGIKIKVTGKQIARGCTGDAQECPIALANMTLGNSTFRISRNAR